MELYTYNPDEQAFVDNYDKINYACWNEKTGKILNIRNNIRSHFLPLQRYRCCYCKMLKQEDHGLTWDVEHILPKAVYPHFLFEPLNLAISCKECNNAKSNDNILTHPITSIKYPKNKNRYLIIHPHFDIYSEHMEIKTFPNEGKIFHIPKSDKGKFTFKTCDLVRFTMSSLGANGLENNILNRISAFIDGCPSDATPEEIKKFFPKDIIISLSPSVLDH